MWLIPVVTITIVELIAKLEMRMDYYYSIKSIIKLVIVIIRIAKTMVDYSQHLKNYSKINQPNLFLVVVYFSL